MLGAGVFHERLWIAPLPELVPVPERLVDHQLAVVGEGDPRPLQGARCGTLEVDAILRVPRPVAGAFELVLGREPTGRAAEMGADGEQRIDRVLRADDPDALSLHPFLGDLPHRVFPRTSRLERSGRLEKNARKQQSESCASGRGEAREHGSPADERGQIPAGPDEVAAFRFGNPGITSGHACLRWTLWIIHAQLQHVRRCAARTKVSPRRVVAACGSPRSGQAERRAVHHPAIEGMIRLEPGMKGLAVNPASASPMRASLSAAAEMGASGAEAAGLMVAIARGAASGTDLLPTARATAPATAPVTNTRRNHTHAQDGMTELRATVVLLPGRNCLPLRCASRRAGAPSFE